MKDWLKYWYIKYVGLVIVFGVWFFILPSDDPGDIFMVCAVPALFIVLLILLIFIDGIVLVVQRGRDAYDLKNAESSTSDEEV